MNISKFFIDRPIFAGVLSIIILLAGALSMFQLPISEYPEVVPPSVVVRAQYPGANPKIIAETVAAPLEESINGVENMLYMQSQANSAGERGPYIDRRQLLLHIAHQRAADTVEEVGHALLRVAHAVLRGIPHVV